jgi:hypothetical protein
VCLLCVPSLCLSVLVVWPSLCLLCVPSLCLSVLVFWPSLCLLCVPSLCLSVLVVWPSLCLLCVPSLCLLCVPSLCLSVLVVHFLRVSMSLRHSPSIAALYGGKTPSFCYKKISFSRLRKLRLVERYFFSHNSPPFPSPMLTPYSSLSCSNCKTVKQSNG